MPIFFLNTHLPHRAFQSCGSSFKDQVLLAKNEDIAFFIASSYSDRFEEFIASW